MPTYDATHFDPPAPVARVALNDPGSEAVVSDVVMLLDTGADVTLLPQASVARLGMSALPDQRYELVSFDGHTSFASVVEVDMIFLGRTFRGRYLLIEEARGILGRDVLNHASILLDGPGLQWAEHHQS